MYNTPISISGMTKMFINTTSLYNEYVAKKVEVLLAGSYTKIVVPSEFIMNSNAYVMSKELFKKKFNVCLYSLVKNTVDRKINATDRFTYKTGINYFIDGINEQATRPLYLNIALPYEYISEYTSGHSNPNVSLQWVNTHYPELSNRAKFFMFINGYLNLTTPEIEELGNAHVDILLDLITMAMINNIEALNVIARIRNYTFPEKMITIASEMFDKMANNVNDFSDLERFSTILLDSPLLLKSTQSDYIKSLKQLVS